MPHPIAKVPKQEKHVSTAKKRDISSDNVPRSVWTRWRRRLKDVYEDLMGDNRARGKQFSSIQITLPRNEENSSKMGQRSRRKERILKRGIRLSIPEVFYV